jgi:hypothetical protein
MSNAKKETLASFLGCEPEELEQTKYDQNLFEYGEESYLVLTDGEADEYARRYILDSLWAFNTDFILPRSRIELDESNEEQILKALKSVQEKLCESANPLIKALLEDEKEFVEDAIAADGRGHFLSQYDGAEEENRYDDETIYYIYRQN